MPSPSTLDPWFNSRRFGIVIDAGSSGSRLILYSWEDPQGLRSSSQGEDLHFLPKVEKGTREKTEWIKKVEPGLSSFGGDPEGVSAYLRPLLDHAKQHIPPSLHPGTPIFLLATAGMRLLPSEQQSGVLKAACEFFRFNSNFPVEPGTSEGPCGRSVRIITGEEEGTFGWIAVNYLMDSFSREQSEGGTFGFLDMGGASTQIAFEPGVAQRQNTSDLIDVRLRLVSGHEIHHQIFVTTWLGYGTNQARERYVDAAVSRSHQNAGSQNEQKRVPDPCLPKNLELKHSVGHPSSNSHHSSHPVQLIGTGSFEKCLQEAAPLLNKNAPCARDPCMFNGVHVPKIDFSVSRFLGVSEYWYSLEDVFGLGGAYDVVQFERAASEFCGREWNDILKEHEEAQQFRTGGVDTGRGPPRWGEQVGIPRLQMQCFKAAWIVNVLHEGIAMPRIIDSKGNVTTNHGKEKMGQNANRLGLDKPVFQSVDSIGDTAISWTLGTMVLVASQQVPAIQNAHYPVESGLDGGLTEDFFRLLTKWPPTITPFFILFYLTSAITVVFVLYRLRRQFARVIRSTWRRSVSRGKAEGVDILEEGHFLTNEERPSSTIQGRWPFSIPKIVAHAPSFLQLSPKMFPSRHPQNGTPRVPLTPVRSFTAPVGRFRDGVDVSHLAPASPRSTSPPLTDPFQIPEYAEPHSISVSLSRNNSQLNLTTLVPRQPISRCGSMSGQNTPTGRSFDNIDYDYD